jgi:hypothetical protein
MWARLQTRANRAEHGRLVVTCLSESFPLALACCRCQVGRDRPLDCAPRSSLACCDVFDAWPLLLVVLRSGAERFVRPLGARGLGPCGTGLAGHVPVVCAHRATGGKADGQPARSRRGRGRVRQVAARNAQRQSARQQGEAAKHRRHRSKQERNGARSLGVDRARLGTCSTPELGGKTRSNR